MKKQCEVEGCAGVHLARGLCSKHYSRLLRGVDPHTPSREEGSLEERFRANLAPKDLVTGCIEWVGYRDKRKGYGKVKYGNGYIRTHRLAWELKHGPIPDGMKVCHRCDNPPCCNEEHLYLGTPADNSADMVAKDRQAKGESNGRAKLTEADVVEIRRRLAAGESQRRIATSFSIAKTQVGNIKAGKTWKHLNSNNDQNQHNG